MDLENIYKTQTEMHEAAMNLRFSGWAVYPFEEPGAGLCGFACSKDGSEMFLKYYRWGKALNPTVHIFDDCDKFVDALANQIFDNIDKCDDPVQRYTGFVSYARAPEGRSDIYQIPLVKMVMAGDEVRGKLMKLLQKASPVLGPST